MLNSRLFYFVLHNKEYIVDFHVSCMLNFTISKYIYVSV